MKRMISLLLVLTLTAGVLAGCGRQNAPTASDDTKLSIVTTIFPEYDWVREIVGEKADHAEITMLLDSGYMWLVPVPASLLMALLLPGRIDIAAAVLVVQVLMNLKVIPALWVLKRGRWVRNITAEGSQA